MPPPTSMLNRAKRLFGSLSAPAAPSLAALRPDQVWGGAEILAGDPPLDLYENVVVLPRFWAVFGEDGDIIPRSAFRRHGGGEIVGAPAKAVFDRADLAVVEEEVVHGGTLHPHFGHMLCTGLSRAWAFARHPDRRIVVHAHKRLPLAEALAAPLAAFCFRQLGVDAARVLQPERPTLFRRMLIPGSAFDEQWRGYEAFRAMALNLGAGCEDRRGGPVYLSKTRPDSSSRGGVHRVVNEAEVEAILARKGVEIVHPEQRSIERQIGLFASGRAIAGLTGSALHMHIFAPATGRLIGLQAKAPMISNQVILDGLAGRRAEYLVPTEPSTEEAPGADGFEHSLRLADPEAVARELLRRL